MNVNIELPVLKGVNLEEIAEQENRLLVYISMPVKEHNCPACGEKTTKVHDYRMRKIGHLPMWGRFAEKDLFIDRYQRFSKEAD